MADITEREAYIGLLDSLRKAREFSRALGLKRGDMRWIKVAGWFDQCEDNCSKLFEKAKNGTAH